MKDLTYLLKCYLQRVNLKLHYRIPYLMLFLLIVTQSIAQIDCELNDVTASITSISGANIISSTATIGSAAPNGVETTGDPLIIEATGCGEISIEITLDYDWVQGSSDDAWIHGVSFSASTGWSSSAAGGLGDGWAYYSSITGDCSGNSFSDGYFYDNCEDSPEISLSSCSCGGYECDPCGSPSDNWGIDCEGSDCPEFSFDLTYCPSETGTQSENISFFLTNDGESGSWEFAIGCYYLVSYPIIIQSVGVNVPEVDYGPDCPGTCHTLDAGNGCDGYEWSTGETTQTIEVCPLETTNYSVTVSSCGPDLIGEYTVTVEECCEADAGNIVAINSNCPFDATNIEVSGNNQESNYETLILATDENGEIQELLNDPAEFISQNCGIYTFYSFNYLIADPNVSLPTVGMSINDINCQIACCDLSVPTPIDFSDLEAPIITLPQIPAPDCWQDYLENYLDSELASYSDNCLGTGTIEAEIISVGDLCSGGNVIWSYTIMDDCQNESTEILEFIIPALPAADWIDQPEPLIVIECGDEAPIIPLLNISNGLSGTCYSGIIEISPLQTGSGSLVYCGDEQIFSWEGIIDDCGNTLASITQTIVVEDSTAPEFNNLPNDLSISCFEDLNPIETLTFTDNCSADNIEVIGTTTEEYDPCNGGEVIRVWEIEDTCGNSNSHIQTITILGVEPIGWITDLPEDIILSCGGEVPAAEILQYNDNCQMEGNVEAEITGEINDPSNPLNYTWTTSDACGNVLNHSQTIYINFDSTVEILGNESLCFGGSTLLFVDGNFNEIDWSTGENGLDILIENAGIFSVSVTDSNGCMASSSIEVIEQPIEEAIISGEPNICQGESTILNAEEGNQYHWEGPSGSWDEQLFEVFEAGNYFLTLEDDNGCISEGNFELLVTENPLPEIDGADTFCPEIGSVLTITENYADLNWSTGSTEMSITALVSGSYSLTVSDQFGCNGSSEIIVTELPSPEITVVNKICNEALGVYDLIIYSEADQIESIPPYNILPLGINEYQVTNIDTSVILELIIQDTGTGCTDFFDILPPDCSCQAFIDIGQSQMIDCHNLTVQLGGVNSSFGSNFLLEWLDESSNVLSNNLFLEVNLPGIYTLQITDLLNNCSESESIEVFENSSPNPIIEGPLSICEGEVATFTLTEDYYIYAWSTNNSSSEILVNYGGSIFVTVTDQNGCTGTNEIILEIEQNPIFEITSTDCNEPTGSYDLYFTSSADQITNSLGLESNELENNQYLISEIDTSVSFDLIMIDLITGCQSIMEVFPPNCSCQAIVDIGNDQILNCHNSEVQLGTELTSSGSNFLLEWNDEQGNLLGNELYLSTSLAGEYTLYVTDLNNNCTASQSVIVNQAADPEVSIVGPEAFCFGESFVLSVPEIYSNIIWSTASSEESITINSPGTFNVVVTDGIGCTAEDEISVDQIELPTLTNLNATCIDSLESYQITFSSEALIFLESNLPIEIVQLSAGLFFLEDIPFEYDIELYLEDPNFGCSSTYIVQAPDCSCAVNADAGPNGEIDCNQPEVEIGGINTSIGDSYEISWFNSSGNMIGTEPKIIVHEVGTYTIQVTDVIKGCSDLDSVMVESFVQDFTLNIDTSHINLSYGQNYTPTILTNLAESQIEKIIWEPIDYLSCSDCLMPIITPLSSIQYMITIVDQYGCESRTTLQIDIDKPLNIFIPNIFTPNGDGDNDYLEIYTDENIANINSFSIYDRWGEKIFERLDFDPQIYDINNIWNGEFNGELVVDGVFVYLIEYETIYGDQDIITGSVSVVK